MTDVLDARQPSYYRTHQDLKKFRGKASEHPCEACGVNEGRREWAYQYSAGGEELKGPKGERYSLNIHRDYSPLCVPCHRSLDLDRDPRILEAFKRNGRRNGKKQKGMPKAPGHIDKVWDARRKKMNEDPEYREEYSRRYSKMASKTNRKRFRCDECGYENNAGNLGWHSKKTGHVGRHPAPSGLPG